MMQCEMDHIVLNVTDVMGMVRFYTEVMPFVAERLEAYREGRVPFPSVRLNPHTIIDLFPIESVNEAATSDLKQRNLNHFCIALDRSAWNRLKDRLGEKGIDVVEGPVVRWGARGNALSMYFKDPEGNTLEARYYEATRE